MCTNWRRLDEILQDVVERALMNAMVEAGSLGGLESYTGNPAPGPAATWVSAGMEWERTGDTKPPASEHREEVVIQRREISSPDGLPLVRASREKTLVSNQPPAEPAPGSASVFSLLVMRGSLGVRCTGVPARGRRYQTFVDEVSIILAEARNIGARLNINVLRTRCGYISSSCVGPVVGPGVETGHHTRSFAGSR